VSPIDSRDDFVAPFSLDGAPVLGRIVRLGAVDSILKRHDYPVPAAMMLGEALALAALIGSLLKVDGRFIVQAQGDGPVRLLVAEHSSDGGLRGYARLAEGAVLAGARRLSPRELIGQGHLAITLDLGPESEPRQGLVSLEGETLSACAEAYFGASEQIETHIRLAVGQVVGDAGAAWRAGGVLMQRIGRDETRGNDDEDWSRAGMLFATLSDEELIDPDLPSDRLLYRLFHEEGVRMGEPAPLEDRCTCNEERLTAILRGLDQEELAHMQEPDGKLHARCQFCGRDYRIAVEAISL
jgi:molecular chaperone Hsp33